MRIKKHLVVALLALAASSVYAQVKVEEPDFFGEAVYLENDSTSTPLEKSYYTKKLKDQLMGPTLKLYVEGAKSSTTLKAGTIRLIAKSTDNSYDPMSIIRIFKFDVGKTRKATLGSVNEITGNVSGAKFKSVSYSAKKYGTSSYLITVNITEPGQYGILMYNPETAVTKNAKGASSLSMIQFISCFGIE